jgi:hypothetical protein
VQLPLDCLECCIHGGVWCGTTLGYVQALASKQDCNAYGITPSLLREGYTGFTDIVIGCIEVFQSLGNPPHHMRGERDVLTLNIYAHWDSFSWLWR